MSKRLQRDVLKAVAFFEQEPRIRQERGRPHGWTPPKSYAALGQRAGCSPAAVKRAVHELRRLGWLSWRTVRDPHSGAKIGNQYYLPGYEPAELPLGLRPGAAEDLRVSLTRSGEGPTGQFDPDLRVSLTRGPEGPTGQFDPTIGSRGVEGVVEVVPSPLEVPRDVDLTEGNGTRQDPHRGQHGLRMRFWIAAEREVSQADYNHDVRPVADALLAAGYSRDQLVQWVRGFGPMPADGPSRVHHPAKALAARLRTLADEEIEHVDGRHDYQPDDYDYCQRCGSNDPTSRVHQVQLRFPTR